MSAERLWESIVVLRESGHRYGMSERDIERFITQVLQTSEPQGEEEEQHVFPLLRTAAKCTLALVLVLVLVLGLSQSQSQSESGSLGLNWSCLGAARLLDLPIAHKYKLQGFRFRLVPATENSSVCADPVVLKGAEGFRLHRTQLDLVCGSQDRFSCSSGVQPGPANFTVHWSVGSETLFPSAQLLLVDKLRRCVVSNLRPSLRHLQQGVQVQGSVVLASGRASVSVSATSDSSNICKTVTLRPGDLISSDSAMSLVPDSDETIFCDGSAP